MAKNKYYVVWNGEKTGVYNNWGACKQQIHGYKGAKYKAFDTEEEAQEAYANGYEHYLKSIASIKAVSYLTTPEESATHPISDSIAVDAACSGNPGNMEYRGVYLPTKKEIFHHGPMKKGTNNIGEFLAIVHALALLKKNNSSLPIYSDSRNAISWIKKKKCKTLLERLPENEPIFELIERAEKWLATNTYTNPVIKWETSKWGEIPADFGRK